jgi:integrase/recombinase XerD
MEHLSREQVVDLLTRARAGRERDWVLFLVSFWHGLRASEAIGLIPENFADGYLNVQRLKGSLRTVQPLVDDELEILNERIAITSWLAKHQEHHHGDGNARRVFPVSRVQFYRLMRRYGRLAGLPQHLCHPHVLKHSIAMQSIALAGIENVRQYLGHKSISSTGAYLRVSDAAASRAIAAATKIPAK